ncbi:MAG: hypothetical protein IKN81_02795 [Oscillospiraceae bacterium]|nr:hypothetical protein [Oscillospiraceae bacterium]
MHNLIHLYTLESTLSPIVSSLDSGMSSFQVLTTTAAQAGTGNIVGGSSMFVAVCLCPTMRHARGNTAA